MLSIRGKPVGQTVATSTGSFRTPLQLNVPVGRYTITAVCGPTLTASIDVVLSSQADPPSSTAAILLFFLLLILALTFHELAPR
jgi:hypothetical protein